MIEKNIIRQLEPLFQGKLNGFPLSPAYEPKAGKGDLEKENEFWLLQQLNRVGLVRPVGADHMYDAAMDSKSCELTPLGHYYRKLVLNRQI